MLGLFGSVPAEASRPEAASGLVVAGAESIRAAELQTVETLQASLKVARAAQAGYVLAISVTATDPAKAARLANAVADAYLVDQLDTRFEAAKRASSWLSDRLVGLRDQLRDVTATAALHPDDPVNIQGFMDTAPQLTAPSMLLEKV